MGFQQPSAYGIVWDLIFRDGPMTERMDISEEVWKIAGQYHDEYRNRDLMDQIPHPFRRDLQVRKKD